MPAIPAMAIQAVSLISVDRVQYSIRQDPVKKGLVRNLRTIDQLLSHARPPKLARRGEVPARVQEILGAIKKRGGRVSKGELGEIVASSGMIVTAVGSLYQAAYLKHDLKDKG